MTCKLSELIRRQEDFFEESQRESCQLVDVNKEAFHVNNFIWVLFFHLSKGSFELPTLFVSPPLRGRLSGGSGLTANLSIEMRLKTR